MSISEAEFVTFLQSQAVAPSDPGAQPATVDYLNSTLSLALAPKANRTELDAKVDNTTFNALVNSFLFAYTPSPLVTPPSHEWVARDSAYVLDGGTGKITQWRSSTTTDAGFAWVTSTGDAVATAATTTRPAGYQRTVNQITTANSLRLPLRATVWVVMSFDGTVPTTNVIPWILGNRGPTAVNSVQWSRGNTSFYTPSTVQFRTIPSATPHVAGVPYIFGFSYAIGTTHTTEVILANDDRMIRHTQNAPTNDILVADYVQPENTTPARYRATAQGAVPNFPITAYSDEPVTLFSRTGNPGSTFGRDVTIHYVGLWNNTALTMDTMWDVYQRLKLRYQTGPFTNPNRGVLE